MSSHDTLSQDTLKRMSIQKTLSVPDLRHLNCARVLHLKVLLAPEPEAVQQEKAGQAGQQQQQQQQQPQPPGIGMQLHSLLEVLRGNTSLTTLTIKGVCVLCCAPCAVLLVLYAVLQRWS